ncbi:hypothetical protein AB0F72_08805 [Actinoplanes sp. NPDC023936]|uniref:hypothetical protein n=1 Tax=Actinoplanes sp. NPDC023936 TaxID=3154910 RepID=UPI0033E6FE73
MTMPDESQIRHLSGDDIDTFRDGNSSETGVPVSATVQPPIGRFSTRPDSTAARPYRATMTISANSVIAAIDVRRPGLSETKRNLLLYFCQGHQLAHSGDALFGEALFATDNGVDLDEPADKDTGEPLSPGQLNTIADALERYGDLSPADLRTLVQASVPWQLAIKSTLGPRIEWAWLRDWFRRPDEVNDPEDDRPTQARVAAWQAGRAN